MGYRQQQKRHHSLALIAILVFTAFFLVQCDDTAVIATIVTVSPTATATPIPHPLPIPVNNPPPPIHIVPTLIVPTDQPTATISATTTAQTTAIVPSPTFTSTPAPTVPPAPTNTPCAGPCPTPTPCVPSFIRPFPPYTKDDVSKALNEAAIQYTVPFQLMEAIAMEESGWQPDIIACTGDTGLMQMSKGTAPWLNTVYSTNYDQRTLSGSANLGAELINYYYTFYVAYLQKHNPDTCGTAGCNWDTVWPGSDNVTIRDIVVSVYNEGATTMGTYGIINQFYVNIVLQYYHTLYNGIGI